MLVIGWLVLISVNAVLLTKLVSSNILLLDGENEFLILIRVYYNL